MGDYINILLKLAENGLYNTLETSTVKLADQLNISQQSASRKLAEMENQDMIKKSASPNGITIRLKQKSIDILKSHYDILEKAFHPITKITGTIKKGIGEGGYYVSQYQEHFKKRLGFKAFPGTLNIEADETGLMNFISTLPKITIDSFKTKERTFGSLTCYPITIGKEKAAIVVPERTRHSNTIIEIIAPVNLRKALSLEDETKVTITR
ncbi:MAG: CTP-dependent riboflavin kinase [Nanoarchaeota archaeon]|nr:CTP-dependent riboflavin kinase [Nanoarchaeota archaeon]